MKSTYHVVLAFVIYALVANGFYLYTHPEQRKTEWQFMRDSVRHIEFFLLQQIVYHSILFFIIYPLTNRWVSARAAAGNQATGRLDLLFTLKIFSIVGGYYLSQLAIILYFDISPVMSIALVTEKVGLVYYRFFWLKLIRSDLFADKNHNENTSIRFGVQTQARSRNGKR